MRGRNRWGMRLSQFAVSRPYSGTARPCKGPRQVAHVLLRTLCSVAKGVLSVARLAQPSTDWDGARGIRGPLDRKEATPHHAVLRVPDLRLVDLRRRRAASPCVPVVLRGHPRGGGRPGGRAVAVGAAPEARSSHAARL